MAPSRTYLQALTSTVVTKLPRELRDHIYDALSYPDRRLTYHRILIFKSIFRTCHPQFVEESIEFLVTNGIITVGRKDSWSIKHLLDTCVEMSPSHTQYLIRSVSLTCHAYNNIEQIAGDLAALATVPRYPDAHLTIAYYILFKERKSVDHMLKEAELIGWELDHFEVCPAKFALFLIPSGKGWVSDRILTLFLTAFRVIRFNGTDTMEGECPSDC